MAGLVGFYKTNKKEGQLDSMLDRINHRGPDYRLKYEDDNLSLAFAGLDLQYKNDRKELFSSEKYVVLLNGYLHNETEVVAKLNELGDKEEYESHSHMIANLYDLISDDFANVVKGLFVIVIYDKVNDELTIVRDVFGVQPIFYYPTENGVIFCSEAKSLLEHVDFKKELNKDALKSYLVFQSPSIRESFFKGAFKLKEASILKVKNRNIDEKQYWDFHFKPKDQTMEDVVNDINNVIGTSIEQTTDMGTEIGSFLSAGVDSSYITSRYRPKKAFTVGFEEGVSEINDAKNLTELIGVEHISTFLDPEELFNDISTIQYFMDEPLANFSALAIYYLAKLARGHVKAVLGGEGADEFFGGYFEYIAPNEVEKFKRMTPGFIRKFLANIAKKTHKDFKGRNFFIKAGLPLKDWFVGAPKVFNEVEATDILKAPYKNGPGRDMLYPLFEKVEDKSDLIKKQYIDFHHWMINDINLKADRMTMAHSLQLITPVVSRDVFEVASQIPDNLKVDGYKVKVAFRQAANEFVPLEWANRKKLGFPVPFKSWLTHENFAKIIEKKVTSKLAEEFFDTRHIKSLIESHKSGKRDQHRKILVIYFFLVWYEKYFLEEK